jgi:hypothetical protein
MKKQFFIGSIFVMLTNIVLAQTNTLPATGSVGIGTTSPVVRLQVQKESSAPAIMIGGGLPGTPRLQIYGLGEDPNAWMGLGTDMGGHSYEHSIYFSKAPSGNVGRLSIGNYNGSLYQSRLTVLDNGNIGLGTENPQSLLHVAGRALMEDNLKILAKDAAWAEGVLVVKPSGWGGLRIARADPSTANYDGNWAIGYNANTGNDFSISNQIGNVQSDYIFHINAVTKNVGIGTSTPSEKLAVNGTIKAKEIKVSMEGWPDYVFASRYKISALSELEKYIKLNNHLPEIPSAKEAEAHGVELGEMNKLLLKKIEELTLYVIELKKESIEQQKQLDQLKKR